MDTGETQHNTSTSKLLSGLFQASALSDFLETQAESLAVPTLPEYLSALCEEKGVMRSVVIRRAGINRSFGFQLFQGTKNPSRDKVLQIAIGFGLGYDETQALLKVAHQSPLYPRIKRDAALIYCLNKHLSFTDTQALLSGLDITILGREPEL